MSDKVETITVPIKRYQELLKIEKDYLDMTHGLNRILKLTDNATKLKEKVSTKYEPIVSSD